MLFYSLTSACFSIENHIITALPVRTSYGRKESGELLLGCSRLKFMNEKSESTCRPAPCQVLWRNICCLNLHLLGFKHRSIGLMSDASQWKTWSIFSGSQLLFSMDDPILIGKGLDDDDDDNDLQFLSFYCFLSLILRLVPGYASYSMIIFWSYCQFDIVGQVYSTLFCYDDKALTLCTCQFYLFFVLIILSSSMKQWYNTCFLYMLLCHHHNNIG